MRLSADRRRCLSIRIAAVGDLHMRPAVAGRFRPAFQSLEGPADVLLLAGDLTNGGTLGEAEILQQEVADLPLPVIAVLGNHDHDEGRGEEIAGMLRQVGVKVLDGDSVVIDVAGLRCGVAGVMGGGGGFGPAAEPDNEGDPDAAARIRRGPADARLLGALLDGLVSDVRVALLHFAPVADTLVGEALEIYCGLGCGQLGEAIDRAGADLVIHGHAHAGTENGSTPGKIAVRNVAYPVLRRPYGLYQLTPRQRTQPADEPSPP